MEIWKTAVVRPRLLLIRLGWILSTMERVLLLVRNMMGLRLWPVETALLPA